MAQRESGRSRRIMKALRAQGWFCFKVHGSEFMMAGLPDIIVCAEGIFVGLETKNPEDRADVSPRQRLVHSMIEASQGTAAIVSSADEAISVVRLAISNASLRLGGMAGDADR